MPFAGYLNEQENSDESPGWFNRSLSKADFSDDSSLLSLLSFLLNICEGGNSPVGIVAGWVAFFQKAHPLPPI